MEESRKGGDISKGKSKSEKSKSKSKIIEISKGNIEDNIAIDVENFGRNDEIDENLMEVNKEDIKE